VYAAKIRIAPDAEMMVAKIRDGAKILIAVSQKQ
jgi:hypothetical protein